ncbi:MAG: Ku protein [Geminicoccaceae bacterium]
MAPSTFWKGYLKLSLVTCPVAMVPAVTESEKVRFHTLSRATGHRVESRYLDAMTGKPVAEKDEAKGYQTGPDDYLILEDEELEGVALESARTIDIDMFVPADSIGWIWYDRPHYLVPDDAVGEEAFAVIRDAMAGTGMVGISRVVLYRRERAVLLEPRDRGIVVWTLRYGDEVRPAEAYLDGVAAGKVNSSQLALVTRLIKDRTEHWEPAMVRDPVQEQLLQVIEAKKKGRRPVRKRAAPEEPSGKVVNIMDALRRSIAAEGGKKPR